jgi:hypothetical protein
MEKLGGLHAARCQLLTCLGDDQYRNQSDMKKTDAQIQTATKRR